jgi:hypothetical protein
MPQPLSEIQGVDNTQNWLAATRAGLVDRQLQQNLETQNQNRLLNQNVGNALAGGDTDEAANIAARGGNIDLYGQLQKWSKQASDDELADANKKHELTANLLSKIQTPEQLEQALGVAVSTNAIKPEDAANIRQQVQKFGLQPTIQYHAAVVGRQNEPIQAALDQRNQDRKDIAQNFASITDPDNEAAHIQALQNLAKQGNTQAQQYLTQEGALVPGARETAMGLGGLGKDVMDNATKADIAETKAKSGGGKASGLAQATENVIQGALKRFPDAKREDIADIAQSAADRRGILDKDEDGNWVIKNPAGSRGEQTERVLSMKDRLAAVREKSLDPDLQRELSEYKAIGKKDGDLAQRKSIAGGALNHLKTVDQISDQDLENALGVIKGSGGYQKFADLVNSGRIENSAAYRNAKQTLSVLLKETQNAYHIAGTGGESDARLKETADALSPDSFLASPNVDVFRERLNNVRAILQGVINSPRPSAFGSRSQNTAGSAASEEEVRRVSGAPESKGQVQRFESGKRYRITPDGGFEEIK